MKLQSLCIFLILLISVHSTDFESQTTVNGYFFYQKVYGGDDPLLIVKNSMQKMELKFFMMNHKVLAFSADEEKLKNVEDGILLEKLFDKEDDEKNGVCCKNVKYVTYPGCSGDTCPDAVLDQKNNPTPMEVAAKNCVEVQKADHYLWRICSDNVSNISKLHTGLLLNILATKFKGGKIDPKIMEKFMMSIADKKNEVENIKNWHWDDQRTWGGQCQNKNQLQSPINIITSSLSDMSKNEIKFGIDYHFDEAHTVIKKYYNELRVHFLESAGVLKYFVDNQFLFYQPEFMSFRFPGEHQFDGKRYPGEVLIHFKELNPNLKTWVTNGLVISIPLEPKKDNPNLDFFEHLNPDFWKVEVKKSGKYEPKQTMGKKLLKFSLQDMFRKVSAHKPRYFTYVGSETTPPCKNKILYLIVHTPIQLSNCQFKVLRENSLLTDRPTEIHARLAQDLKNRKVYEAKHTQLTSKHELKSVIHMIEQKYKEYTTFIKKVIGPKPQAACGGANGLADAVIKKPIEPKNMKELNKKIDEVKKEAAKAAKLKGPEGEQARKDVAAKAKEQVGQSDCDKI